MTTGKSNLIEVAGEVRRETAKAVLWYDGAREVWLPKSMIDIDEDEGTVALPEPLAFDKGLI